jgi:hypothetical protein
MKTFWPNLMALAVLISPATAEVGDAKPRDAAASKPAADRLCHIIDEVRQAEDRYRNLETAVRIAWQDESRSADPQDRLSVSKREETRYMVQQGDFFLFKWRKMRTVVTGEQVVTEQVAAYDGQTTRSVIYGDCVNLFSGRHVPSQVCPPHSWGMHALQVNFPLSVYLQGTDAIKTYAKDFRLPLLASGSGQGGSVFQFGKLDVSVDGDEPIDGLACVKLRCRHSYGENDRPVTEEVWLAPQRNYLCARAIVSRGDGEKAVMLNETRVTEWTEAAHDLWLPKQVNVTHFNSGRRPADASRVLYRESQTLDRVTVNPDYPAGNFRSVNIPDGLPVYRIDSDGFLEGSAMKSVKAPAADRRGLERVIDELKRAEQRCQRYEVLRRLKHRSPIPDNLAMPGRYLSWDETERTVSLPGKLCSERHQKSHTVAQGDPVSFEQAGWDGEWLRTFNWHADNDDLLKKRAWASLQKGGPNGLNAFRPHTALFNNGLRRPLSDFLTSQYSDEFNKYRHLVEYLGEETVDGLTCEKLRLGSLTGNQKEPKSRFLFLWLAKERNYLPVRLEGCELSRSDRLPTNICYVDDLREVAPGIWFPYHVVHLWHEAGNRDGLGSGQILVDSRQDRAIESISLDPDAPDEIFAPLVPAGTMVSVNGGTAHYLGLFRQKYDGPPQVTEARFTAMAENARVDPLDREDRQCRQAAMDALIGTPLPEIRESIWLNSPPLSNDSLAGKVLLLAFWAEWSPSHDELKHLGRDANVTVIGVHPAGSDAKDIEDLANEFGLDCPIYVDRPDAGGKSRWGRLFEHFAVRELPHAFVVDRQGKLVAHGRLDRMIRQAQLLAGGQ